MSELLVRRATAADAATLVAFNADVSRYQDAATPDDLIAAWTRDLMAGRHPRVDASDFVVTEDSRSGAIVSALALISQTWSYDGVDVEVGQPELVGTHPDYRGRGLIRRQFEVIHRWRAERGQKLLAIDGIPGFYRQFGYEMALELRGELSIDAGSVPRLNALDPYRLRPAADAGRLTNVASWRQPLGLQGIEKLEPTMAERAAAMLPGQTFLQLLFGHRSLDELQHAWADCLVRTETTRTLLSVLFPKRASNVWPVL